MANFRPTSEHWVSITKVVVKLKVFDEYFQLACQQALWQFSNALPIMAVDDSTQAAKEDAVFNLIYINMVRMVFAQLIQSTDRPILPIDFFNKLSKIKDETEMENFVKTEFIPLLNLPSELGINLPKYSATWDVSTSMRHVLSKKKQTKSQADALKELENSFFRTIGTQKASEGANRLVMSIMLAVTTMPKTAISTFPLLAALGQVSDRLQTICGWTASLTQKIKDKCRVQQKKVQQTGFFQSYFRMIESNAESSSPTKMAAYAKYLKLMLVPMSGTKLKDELWKNEVTVDEIRITERFFNRFDSDVAIITSELLDLCSSDLAMAPRSSFNVEAMSEPGSHLSSLERSQELDSIWRSQVGNDEAYLDASFSEENRSWSEADLHFFDRTEQSSLFRVDGKTCLYYDYDVRDMCHNPAVNNTARCEHHQNTANSKFMQILSRMNNHRITMGFSISTAIFRPFSEPQIKSEHSEHAPCLEGALPPYRYGENNLRKCLIAGFKSFKSGYLTKSTIPFQDNHFREQFPNSKIPYEKWKHAYIAIRVSLISEI